MEVGVVLDILWPLSRIERLAGAAAAAGFDQIWVSDHPLGHDPFLVAHHLALRHRGVRIGIGTVNPSTRHPTVLAASAGGLAHLTGGRFTLGIGSSINALLHPIGLDVSGQIPRCREAILIIRQLLEAGVSTLDGDVFQTRDACARFEGAAPVPVLVGASGGPAMLEMTGEVAHGAIIPAGNRGFYRYMIGRLRAAFEAAGRDGEPAIVLNGNISVGADATAALDAIRPLVADALVHRANNRHSLRHLGITAAQAHGWCERPESLPDDVVRECAIAGTPRDCVEGLRDFARQGITQMALRFPELETIESVGREVLPLLRAVPAD